MVSEKDKQNTELEAAFMKTEREKTVLVVFGTRPEAIKVAPVVHELRSRHYSKVITCVTAQHREMLDQVLEWFQIKPDYDLNLMTPTQTLADLTGRAVTAISSIIQQVQPDIVLVQGDTTTAMTAALAAFYSRIPIGHIEAGLRTRDIYNPFPEEVNRRLISVMGSHHFAPTITARDALITEGVDPTTIHITGNTVIDALQWTVARPFSLKLDIPLETQNERIVLVTAHRRESFGKSFENICKALRQITERNSDVRLIYPVHLNPNVQEPAYRILDGAERIHLIPPLSYPAFAHLMKLAFLILTDSGGIQEEAPALGKPVLVLRRTTERPEAIEAGTARLVGTDANTITESAEELLHNTEAYNAMANAVSPFGDGHAARRIVDTLLEKTS